MTRRWLVRFARAFSPTGLLVATLFFAASLTPSLIPRTALMQGVLSGVSFAAGYGVGISGVWLWHYLGLPTPRQRINQIIALVAAVICTGVALVFLLQAAEWQNSIRERMEMEPVHDAQPFQVGLIALLVFGVLYLLGRLFHLTFQVVAWWLRRHVPHRVSNVIGIIAAVALFWAVFDGVLFNFGLRAVDASFQQWDAVEDPGIAPPSDPMKTGSEASLIAWDDLGRMGRYFVSSGPTKDDMSQRWGAAAKEPIRVFVGLNSEETPEARAKLALEELRRVGAFKRSALVIVTPTGTGWIDPAAMNTVERLHRGDIASVAVQYSYLTSWLALLVEPGYGVETAQALFDEVYAFWRQLPKGARPKLYLHGLSLGAMNSELSADLYDVVGEPFQGALWSGPPFPSRTWRFATTNRRPDSPAWLPRFRDGSIIRFANQKFDAQIPGADWGPIRIVYLQYASDPVTFFNPEALYREPDWMSGTRGPDVSPELRWFPIVSLLQLTIDIASATLPPVGYGHNYAPEDYIDAWVAVADPPGWTDKALAELKADYLARRGGGQMRHVVDARGRFLQALGSSIH